MSANLVYQSTITPNFPPRPSSPSLNTSSKVMSKNTSHVILPNLSKDRLKVKF